MSLELSSNIAKLDEAQTCAPAACMTFFLIDLEMSFSYQAARSCVVLHSQGSVLARRGKIQLANEVSD